MTNRAPHVEEYKAMQKSHFIYAYKLETDGSAQALNPDESDDLLKPGGGYSWLHMCALCTDTRAFLEGSTDLDPIIIDAMLVEETRPRALIKEDGMLIILRAMNLNEDQDPEDMISIRMWIDENKVITTRRRDIKAIDDIIGFIQSGKAPVSTCDFLTMITDRLFERMEPFLIDLEDHISKAEETLASGDDKATSNDVCLGRKRAAIFTRYVTPQKKVLETLLKAEFKWLKEEHKQHLVESLDRVTRYVEELYELRARSQILNDEINNAHGRRLNDITYIFSVAATIFLPLSFLTGLMGINIGGMPGIDSHSAFWIFTGFCTTIVTIQVAMFKKFKWF